MGPGQRRPPVPACPVKTLIVGVDPGSVETGVCALSLGHTTGVAARVVTRDRNEADIFAHAQDVVQRVRRYLDKWSEDHDEWWVAVEGLKRVNPHLVKKGHKPIDLFPVIEAAVVLGVVVASFPGRAVIVPPGGHGSAPLRSYPQQLIGPREKKGTGVLRHARSAYDVARASRAGRLAGGRP